MTRLLGDAVYWCEVEVLERIASTRLGRWLTPSRHALRRQLCDSALDLMTEAELGLWADVLQGHLDGGRRSRLVAAEERVAAMEQARRGIGSAQCRHLADPEPRT